MLAVRPGRVRLEVRGLWMEAAEEMAMGTGDVAPRTDWQALEKG
ncbi:hypothetical protein ACLB1R_00405 [Escherichia coli]